MHWFGGTMAEAVLLSKQRNTIFVVFVEGDNDLSKELSATIDESAVLSRLNDQKNFLAVKLKSGSDNYTYFAQIYQFVPVPSLFFIGRNGTPLEVVCAGIEANNLATRIDRILEEHRKDPKIPSVQPSTSSQNIKEETVNLLQAEANRTQPMNTKETPCTSTPKEATPDRDEEPETSNGPAAKVQKTEHHEVTRSGVEYDVVCDGDVCVRKPRQHGPGTSQAAAPRTVDNAGASTAGATNAASVADTVAAASEADDASTVNLEDKVERAKELIEAKRREKVDKEKEEERQKELDRRSVGQGVSELKKWQADQELKQIQEERKREKMENNLARQRILEQIAQDRAERKARDQPQPAQQPQQAPQQQPVSATWGDGAGRARLQLKLPDGGAHTAHFDATAPLGDVQRYIAENLQLSPSQFSLWTAFPRQELTELTATLRQLRLAPSAALLVLPRRTVVATHTPSPFASLISFFTQLFTSIILEPSYQVYSWIRERLFPSSSSGAASAPSAPATTPPRGPASSVGGVAGLRRRGNIHRLGGDRTSDDDNNTWNGNSTQQM